MLTRAADEAARVALSNREKPMKKMPNALIAVPIALAAIALGCAIGLDHAKAQGSEGDAVFRLQTPLLALTPEQRSAIYAAATNDKSKTAPTQFSTVVGAEVPPQIELYALPEVAVGDNPAAKYYKYTVVQGRVVLVDPTKMRVVEVIGPKP